MCHKNKWAEEGLWNILKIFVSPHAFYLPTGKLMHTKSSWDSVSILSSLPSSRWIAMMRWFEGDLVLTKNFVRCLSQKNAEYPCKHIDDDIHTTWLRWWSQCDIQLSPSFSSSKLICQKNAAARLNCELMRMQNGFLRSQTPVLSRITLEIRALLLNIHFMDNTNSLVSFAFISASNR